MMLVSGRETQQSAPLQNRKKTNGCEGIASWIGTGQQPATNAYRSWNFSRIYHVCTSFR